MPHVPHSLQYLPLAFLPTRVLDVGNDSRSNIFLCDFADNQSESYPSYPSLGLGVPASVPCERSLQYKRVIQHLQQTLKDAVEMTRRLPAHYLRMLCASYSTRKTGDGRLQPWRSCPGTASSSSRPQSLLTLVEVFNFLYRCTICSLAFDSGDVPPRGTIRYTSRSP